MYSSNSFAHSALEEDCQHHAPATLPQGRSPLTIVQEAVWTPGMVWTDTENFACTEFDSRIVHPVACHYKMHAVRSVFHLLVTQKKSADRILRSIVAIGTGMCVFMPVVWCCELGG